MSVYGYCPICGAEGVERERRPNGYDTCKNGDRYLSKCSIVKSESKLEFTSEESLINWLKSNLSVKTSKETFVGPYGEREKIINFVVKYKDNDIVKDFYNV